MLIIIQFLLCTYQQYLRKNFTTKHLWLDLYITLCTVSGRLWYIINNSTIKCDFFLYITKLTQYLLLEWNEKSWSLNIFIKFRHFCFCSLTEWRTKDLKSLWNPLVRIYALMINSARVHYNQTAGRYSTLWP